MTHYLYHQGRHWRVIWDGSCVCFRVEIDRYSVKIGRRGWAMLFWLLRWRPRPL